MCVIETPKIYTFEDITTELVEIFAGVASATYLKPQNQELFELLADKEFLDDWLINSLDENIADIISDLANTVDDKEADSKIQSYLKMLANLRSQTELYHLTFVHEDSTVDYVSRPYEQNQGVQDLYDWIDWDGYAEQKFSDCETVELNYPEIGFSGTWYYTE